MTGLSKCTQITNWLLGKIEQGALKPGGALPSRSEIMSHFNVARATADKAIATLIKQGRAFSRQGAGTFASAGTTVHRVFIINPTQENTNYLCGLFNGKIAYEILQSNDIESAWERIIRSGSRIIWNCPNTGDRAIIAKLEKIIPHQLIINRRHPSINYITTDTQTGIKNGISIIKEWMGKDVPWGIIAPPLDFQRYYWAEREIFFYQEIMRYKNTTIQSVRVEDEGWNQIHHYIEELLQLMPSRFALYTPEQLYVPQILEMCRNMNLQPGRDFALLMTDRQQEFDAVAGIVSLEQNFNQMMEKAAQWALTPEPQKINALIRHSIHKGAFYGPS